MTLRILQQPFDRRFGRLLDDFRAHQGNVKQEVGFAKMIEDKATQASIMASQQQLEKYDQNQSQERLVVSLRAVDYKARYRKPRNIRRQGSGDWIIDNSI